MGVRLVVHNFIYDEMDYTGTHNHDDLIHRDWVDQHPIYAITGLQEVLNTIETELFDISRLLLQKEAELKQYSDTGISNESQVINQRIDGLSVVDNIEDTDGIDLDYDNDTKTLKADLKRYDDPGNTNALSITHNGIYVPKFVNQNTKSITWDTHNFEESLSDIFENGLRFSHQDTNAYNNLFNATEANAWEWDATLNTIKQPMAANSYNGIISNNYYDNYRHSVRIISDGANNNANGIVLGFIFDEHDHPHTLSAMVQRDDDIYLSYRFAIIYNFQLPDQELVDSYNLLNFTGDWTVAPNGISLYATKNGNLVSVSATRWNYANNSTDLTEAASMPFEATLNINLDNYSWGHYFTDKVRYGYSNLLQEDSYFDHVFFESLNQTSPNIYSCDVNLDEDETNNLEIRDGGLFSKKFLISQAEENALSEKEDGYYVQKFTMAVSEQRLNGLERSGDEYYVHKSHSYVTVEQDNHGFSIGEFIYFDTRTDIYQKALAKDDFDINIVGMVSYIYDENKFEYICSGFVETDLFSNINGFVQGIPLYISDTTPGAVTQNQPNISKAVGYPVENIGLIISIERGIQYSQEAQIGDFKKSANDYNIRSDGFIKVKDHIQYKLNLMQKLLLNLSDEFKQKYVITDEETNVFEFQNTNELYVINNIASEDNINLFIKAF